MLSSYRFLYAFKEHSEAEVYTELSRSTKANTPKHKQSCIQININLNT